MASITTTAITSGTASSSAPAATTTDNTPGYVNSKGLYVPTAAERTEYQAARIPWAAEVVYGYYTFAFLFSVMALFVLANVLWKYRLRYGLNKIPLYSSVAAGLRLFTYPRLRPSELRDLLWTFGSLGPNIVLFAGLLFVSCLTWINKYYYYTPFYGSAPLCLRTEWIAMATLPFVYVLGTKQNLISVMTGVSHDKLQVLHQGAAFNFVYMSLVHTISAVIRARDSTGLVPMLKNNSVYLSGFVALAPLLILLVASLPVFRRAGYEVFYWLHMIMALFFLAALFWHGYGLLDNDAYCVATIVLFLSAVAWRVATYVLNNATMHAAHVSVMPDGVTLKIVIPTVCVKWDAGQHVFLRFTAVRPLESHPFTILNCYPQEATAMYRDIVFIVRARTGFTASLLENVVKKGGVHTYAALVDGPYGHPVAEDLMSFDRVLLCAGGSGISFAIGIAQALLAPPMGDEETIGEKSKKIKLVWVIRDDTALEWVKDEILDLMEYIEVVIHVTGELRSDRALRGDDLDDGTGKEGLLSCIERGKPKFSQVIGDEIRAGTGSIAIGACGPASLLVDCANAVTRAELDILQGRLPDVDEVYLVSESFGW